jgi:splicing factor U2AF subunit
MAMASGGAAYARQARRLYVGNITFEATENNIAEFFNVQMRERGWANDADPAGLQGPDPVVSVQVNHEKSYAFVEVSLKYPH